MDSSWKNDLNVRRKRKAIDLDTLEYEYALFYHSVCNLKYEPTVKNLEKGNLLSDARIENVLINHGMFRI
jgi:hypothetical protein